MTKGFNLVKGEVGSHILSRVTRGGNGCELQQSQKLKTVRLLTYYHRMTPKLNVKRQPLITTSQKSIRIVSEPIEDKVPVRLVKDSPDYHL